MYCSIKNLRHLQIDWVHSSFNPFVSYSVYPCNRVVLPRSINTPSTSIRVLSL